MTQESNICRICLDNIVSNVVKPCQCTNGAFHIECFLQWINTSKRDKCEVCLAKYKNIQKKKEINYSTIINFLMIIIGTQVIEFYLIYVLIDIFTYDYFYWNYYWKYIIYVLFGLLYFFSNIIIFSILKKKYPFIEYKYVINYELLNPLINRLNNV